MMHIQRGSPMTQSFDRRPSSRVTGALVLISAVLLAPVLSSAASAQTLGYASARPNAFPTDDVMIEPTTPDAGVVPERLRPYVLEPVTEMPAARDLAADGLDMARVRSQIHAGRKIALCYRDEQGRESKRVVWPVTVGYMETVRHLIAWCELRQDFRSFRTDRVTAAGFLDERYPERPSALRAKWRRRLEALKRQMPCGA